MKTPIHPFTIHVIEAKYVVPYVATPRPSLWVRARPCLAQGLTHAGRGLVHSARVTWFVIAALFHQILRAGLGAVHGICLIHFVSMQLLEFVFLTFPLCVMGLLFLLATLACAWGLVEAIYRDLSHLLRP